MLTKTIKYCIFCIVFFDCEEGVVDYENPQEAYEAEGLHAMISYVYDELISVGARKDECCFILDLREYEEYDIQCFLIVCATEALVEALIMDIFYEDPPDHPDLAYQSVLNAASEELDFNISDEYYMNLYKGCSQMLSLGRFRVKGECGLGLPENCTTKDVISHVMGMLSEQNDLNEKLKYIYNGVRAVIEKIVTTDDSMKNFCTYFSCCAARKLRFLISN